MTETSRSGGLKENVFRLLAPSRDTIPDGAASVDVAGLSWRLVDHGAVPLPAGAPKYTCVSYSWGSGRAPNPFDPDRLMSTRALPALETAIAASQNPPQAIWLDAACMPTRDPARSLCLRSMGAIYAAASGVFAVLSPSASPLLDKVRRDKSVDPEDLLLLEADDWVSRAWTYQEIANSQTFGFVAEGDTAAPVDGNKLLNAVGHALTQYRKTEQVDAYEFHKRHSILDALETLIDDWLRGGYAERSAYQIMSNMVARTAVDPDDCFHAMIGAITSAPAVGPGDAAPTPSEYFMQVCEQKGDFSFIYSTAPRDAGGWRPGSGSLPPVVPWPSAGERQTGELCSATLHLHNMAHVARGELDGAARKFIQAWLEKTVRSPLPPGIENAARETLRRAGFTGCGEWVETTHGLFFPQHALSGIDDCSIFVATDVFFNFGAPGLLLAPAKAGTTRLRDVGVFVGSVPQARKTVTIE